MKIGSVAKYKGSTYEVVLDDGRKLYLHADIIVDEDVRPGRELDRDELRKIIYASNFRRAYQRALYLLDYRDYSSAEMYEKLEKNYKSPKLCGAVMKKLTDNGFINDERYAEKLARKYVEVKKFGYRRARFEIVRKGIDQFTAEDALAEYEESFGENLAELIEKKYARYLADPSDRKAVEKVKSALVRSGYSYAEIDRAVKEYLY